MTTTATIVISAWLIFSPAKGGVDTNFLALNPQACAATAKLSAGEFCFEVQVMANEQLQKALGIKKDPATGIVVGALGK